MNNLINAFISNEGVSLTKKQRQVLETILSDMTRPEIQSYLDLKNPNQVNTHMRLVANKFGLNTRLDVQYQYILFLEERLEGTG